MRGLREEKTNAQLANAAAYLRKRQIDAHSQRFEDVRRTAARTNGTVAVLGHARTGRGCHNSRRRGNIERVEAIAAGAAGVHHTFGWEFVHGEDRRGMPAHYRSKAGEFRNLNGPLIQPQKQTHDIGGLQSARKKLFHKRFGVGASEDAA